MHKRYLISVPLLPPFRKQMVFIKPDHSVKLKPSCLISPSFPFRFTCHGLATGQSYIFRVRAVNAAGLSEYSQDSEAIEVKAAIGKFLMHNLVDKNGFFNKL